MMEGGDLQRRRQLTLHNRYIVKGRQKNVLIFIPKIFFFSIFFSRIEEKKEKKKSEEQVNSKKG